MKELEQAFAANFREGLELGASVSVWRGGQEVCNLCGGSCREGEGAPPWQPDTLVPIYSATKAAAGACLLLALYDCCQSPDMEIGVLWPAFPAPHCSIAQFLSHQCGLASLAESAPITDLAACRRAIEHSRPLWAPPEHGYHPHSFGPIADILMLELCGQRIGAFWEERVRRPLQLDFYIGLPASEFPRVAMLRPPHLRGALPQTDFYRGFFNTKSPVYGAFHCILGPDSAREMSCPEAWQIGCPAKGGVASARALAQFYQAVLGQLPSSPFPRELMDWMRQPQCEGYDHVLCERTGFGCACMYAPEELFGQGGFGHAGAGGFLGFAEPQSGLSFAYVMNAMELGVLPGERVRRLVRALARDQRCFM